MTESTPTINPILVDTILTENVRGLESSKLKGTVVARFNDQNSEIKSNNIENIQNRLNQNTQKKQLSDAKQLSLTNARAKRKQNLDEEKAYHKEYKNMKLKQMKLLTETMANLNTYFKSSVGEPIQVNNTHSIELPQIAETTHLHQADISKPFNLTTKTHTIKF